MNILGLSKINLNTKIKATTEDGAMDVKIIRITSNLLDEDTIQFNILCTGCYEIDGDISYQELLDNDTLMNRNDHLFRSIKEAYISKRQITYSL